MKKDKEKVLDEVWTTDRVKAFLAVQPAANIDADFHALLKAYQAMRLENFIEFVAFFVEAGRDINAQDPQGNTLLSIVSEHRHGKPYAEVLVEHGAK